MRQDRTGQENRPHASKEQLHPRSHPHPQPISTSRHIHGPSSIIHQEQDCRLTALHKYITKYPTQKFRTGRNPNILAFSLVDRSPALSPFESHCNNIFLPTPLVLTFQPIVAFQKRQKRRRTTIAINQSEARKVQPRLKENTHFALRLLLLIDNKAKKRDRRPGSTTTTPLYLFIALFATLIQLSFSA